MKKFNNPVLLFATVFMTTMVLLGACKKETSAINTAEEKNFSELSSHSSIATYAAFDDVFNNVMGVNDEVAIGQTGVFGRIITIDSSFVPCFTVQVDRSSSPNVFPVKVVLDFGTGCTGKDGRVRKGKIITVYSGPLTVAGKAAETTFENYYLNDTLVEGKYRVENTGTSSQNIFTVTIKDGKITSLNGNYSQLNSINTITQMEGSATPKWPMDDVMSISGESNGSVKSEATFLKWNAKIIDPLIKKFTCHWYVKGKMGMLQLNTSAALIDFGDGECNNKANLIINGLTTEITLH